MAERRRAIQAILALAISAQARPVIFHSVDIGCAFPRKWMRSEFPSARAMFISLYAMQFYATHVWGVPRIARLSRGIIIKTGGPGDAQ